MKKAMNQELTRMRRTSTLWEGKEKGSRVPVSNVERWGISLQSAGKLAAIAEVEKQVEVCSVWVVGSVELDAVTFEELDWTIVKGNRKRGKKGEVIEEETNIHQVTRDDWDSFSKAVVTVDSAADVSVCPKD